MSTPTNPNNPTIFDEEINQLEKRRAEVETERQKLLAGHITVTGPDGTTLTNINLGALSAVSSDQRTVERNLRQTLLENPLVPVLDNSFKKTRELREEMIGRGDTSTTTARSASPFDRLIRFNLRSNRAVSGKSNRLGKVFASPWLLVVGMTILLFWCGGPLLYTISGGTIGGKTIRTTVPEVPSVTPNRAVTPNSTTTRTTGLNNIHSVNLVARVDNIEKPLDMKIKSQFQQAATTPTPALQTDYVGGQPSDAGGLNGPHGAFLAPSRMIIAVLGVDKTVLRAITQNNPNGSESVVSWPRPGEVVHSGAYPGEIGNMLIMGNQADLGALRHIQQNDEVTVYDRKGNAFIYRILAFSADGQTERIIDPTSLEDAWVFGPTDEAILTILVTYPQPLPAVDPNQTGNNQVTPKDDYLVQKRLAYRGVLAMYAPAGVTPAGTPVVVPESTWQTVAASSQQLTITTAGTTDGANQPTPTPQGVSSVNPPAPPAAPTTPGVSIPSGLPNTGQGGGEGRKFNPRIGRYYSSQ